MGTVRRQSAPYSSSRTRSIDIFTGDTDMSKKPHGRRKPGDKKKPAKVKGY